MKRLNTIRCQLTIWNSLVVILTSLLALFLVRQAMVFTLEKETRELLREEAVELELAVKQFYPDQERIVEEFNRKVLSHSRNKWFASLVDADDDRTIWQSEHFPAGFQTVDQANPDFSFRQTDEVIACRHRAITLSKSFVIVIGAPTGFIRRDLASLTKILIWIGLGVLTAAPVGGYLLARRAMLPVQEIVETTQRLNPGSLEDRLVVRGSGDELDQISVEINSFLDLNARYITGQREFIANAAHELRSPLTAIQTSAEVCVSTPRSDEEYRDQLETVIEQCQMLRHLVNQLLELAETDAGLKVNKVRFDFSELVRKSIAIFQGVAEEKNVSLSARVSSKIQILGDSSKLFQVVSNLIDNAIKFSPPGGIIELDVAIHDRDVQFRISNQGENIPDCKLARLFDRFYQVDTSRTREQKTGNGLGLSICQSIIQLHGGEISVVQANGRFEFQFRIPSGDII